MISKKGPIEGNAIIVSNGLLGEIFGKTANGLIRGTDRFNILGVIDHIHAGKDAGEVLDGKPKNIPVYASITDFFDHSSEKPDYCIVGGAFPGGALPDDWNRVLLIAIENGLSIINGLHQYLSEIPMFQNAARKFGVELLDIRKPRTINELHFWNGEVLLVKTPKIAVLGIDCATGKRTTSRFLMETCRENGIQAEMIYTGQTGWMQGYKHGFIFDATLNDFVSGEIEKAIVECDRQLSPDLILIEGQSGLQSPSGPCGSELILSGNVKGVILQYTPFRTYFEDLEDIGCLLPSVENEIKLIGMYGARILAVTLNGENKDENELIAYQKKLNEKLNIPVIRPLEEGVLSLIPAVKEYIKEMKKT